MVVHSCIFFADWLWWLFGKYTIGFVGVFLALGTAIRVRLAAAKCHYEPKTAPVLRIPNVINGRIDLSDLKYGSFSKEEEKKLALKAGDLLVIRSNGSLDLVGRVALVPKTVAGHLYAGYLIRIRLDRFRVPPCPSNRTNPLHPDLFQLAQSGRDLVFQNSTRCHLSGNLHFHDRPIEKADPLHQAVQQNRHSLPLES